MTDFAPPGLSANGTSRPSAAFSLPAGLGLLYGIINPITYPGVLEAAEQATPEISYAGIRVVEDDEQQVMSHIGTPVMYPVTLKGGTYRKHDSSGKVVEVTMGDLRLPMATVMEMARAKSITKTAVVAAQASVKEVYALDDWTIRLSGILIDEPSHPQGATRFETLLERMQDYFELADAIEVECDLLSKRRIYRLVMKSLSVNQFPGKPRVHGYQIEAESDDPLELILQ